LPLKKPAPKLPKLPKDPDWPPRAVPENVVPLGKLVLLANAAGAPIANVPTQSRAAVAIDILKLSKGWKSLFRFIIVILRKNFKTWLKHCSYQLEAYPHNSSDIAVFKKVYWQRTTIRSFVSSPTIMYRWKINNLNKSIPLSKISYLHHCPRCAKSALVFRIPTKQLL
jgi:hypothetical protein